MRHRVAFRRCRRIGGRCAAVLAFTTAVLLVPAGASGVVRLDDLGQPGYADLDTREGRAAPSDDQRAIVARLDARVRWNEFGTPQSLIRDGGFLAAGVPGDDAAAAARAFVRDNLALFRLESLDGLELAGDARLSDGGGRVVTFQQRYGDRTAAPDGTLTIALDHGADGWRIAYVSSRVSGDEALAENAGELSLIDAWVASARAVGRDVAAADVREIGSRGGWTRLEVANSPQPQLIRPVAFQTPARGALAAFETYVDRDGDQSYRQIVDAQGEVLFRQSAVDHAVDNPQWRVFPAYPHLALDHFPWNYPSADIRDDWCWVDDRATATTDPTTRACQLAVANPASKREWDVDARTQSPTFTTVGNNAQSGENWGDPVFPTATQYRPTSPTRDYVYPWTNVWFETLCNPSNFVPGVGNDIDAATANLFAMHNRMHDWSYHLGFREDTWNAQEFNYGVRPEGERDSIIGDAQAGGVTGGSPTFSGRNNANMFTRPDGQNSWSNMYLWQPIVGFYAPCVDGDYDMSVIGHEYGHMIENRMIGKGNRRFGFHAGAMGESHSDLMSMEYLNEWGFVPAGGGDHPMTDDGHTTLVGPYVTSNDERGIRNYNMSFPFSGLYPQAGQYPKVNALNFSDVGYDITGPQVHADGEIWSATNFDIRELLNDRYPYIGLRIQRECAEGVRPVYDCPGNRRWMQLVFDSYLLMPPRPSFLDARDAQLAADLVRFGGANQDLLWLAFARRGFGQEAFNRDAEDTEPKPDFQSPLHEEATVVFNAVAKDEGKHPVPARIYVGHYEARVSPIADTDPTSTSEPPGANNLDNVARFVPDDGAHTNSRHRAYDFVAHAKGYGHVRFRLTELKPGETREVTIEFPTNWASRYKGAVATGDGVRHEELIDDTEDTNWEVVGEPAQGRQVLVQLPGRQRFDRVKVSAMLLPAQPGDPGRPAQNRLTAVREFEVFACTAGEDRLNPGCDPARRQGFKPVVDSQWDAFPGFTPRPVAPELNLRLWPAATTTATHVLFRVLDNQCTGQPYFQGEQDTDPTNNTDCRVGGPLPPRDEEVRAAELQLQSSRPVVIGAQVEE